MQGPIVLSEYGNLSYVPQKHAQHLLRNMFYVLLRFTEWGNKAKAGFDTLWLAHREGGDFNYIFSQDTNRVKITNQKSLRSSKEEEKA